MSTLDAIPDSYQGKFTAVLNEEDPHVLARAIFVMILAFSKLRDAYYYMLHLLYSIKWTIEIDQAIMDTINADLVNICSEISERPADRIHDHCWTRGNARLRVTLRVSEWRQLRKVLVTDFSMAHIERETQRTMNNIYEKDHAELRYAGLPRAMRTSENKYRESGILMPFGHCIESHEEPNL